MIQPYYNYVFMPFLPPDNNEPPTVYAILNSIVNGDKEEEDYTKIKNLASEGRGVIFDFDYPLSEHIQKEDFEKMILNKYLMRRIGFETVTAFKIALDTKLNEIMPLYNKMFDALENWQIFDGGEVTVREGTDNTTAENQDKTTNKLENSSKTRTQSISDRRYSDTPEDHLEAIQDGSYMTDYNYDTNNNTGTDTSLSNGQSETNGKNKNDRIYKETITRSPGDKVAILKEMQENIKSIYSLIFKELDILFYSLV